MTEQELNKKCAKCGLPTDGQYQAFNHPLCKICASWFGATMIRLRLNHGGTGSQQ